MKRRWKLLASATVAVATAEIGLRVCAALTHRERGIELDARLGWRMKPGAVKSGYFWGGARPSRINSHGWRDVERSFAKPAGVRRVIVLGDSFTFGVGVDGPDRFTDVLEKSAGGVEVLNLGMNAVGPDQELLVLETDGLRYAPDFVVCALFEGNDFADVRYSRNSFWPKPHFRLEGGALVETAPETTWDVRLRTCGYVGEALYRLVQRWTPYRTESPEWAGRDTLPLVLALVVRMHDDAERAGARFALFVIRSLDHTHAADPLVRELAARGIVVVDSGERLDDAALHLPHDGHWNAAGHRAAAELLLAGLRSAGWL